MKKYLFLLLPVMTILLMPTGVSAKSKCEAVSGTGKNIGDEIACDSEHFYVLENDGDNIKMLAKYNLYTGSIINREKIERAAGDTRSDAEYCSDLATERGGKSRRDGVYNVDSYCFIEKQIEANEIKQNSQALSAHWDEGGNYLYPQVGDVYLHVSTQQGPGYMAERSGDFYPDVNTASKYDNYFHDYASPYEAYMIYASGQNAYYSGASDSNMGSILKSYRDTLESDFEIKNIDLMTLDDVNNVVKKNNKTIPYYDWYRAAQSNRMNSDRLEFAFLDDYLTKEQSFIFGTTYWIRTGYGLNQNYGNNYGNNNNMWASGEYVLFIDSAGGVCESGYKLAGNSSVDGDYTIICGSQYFNYISEIGCGIRPVVVIANDLKYRITIKVDGNGKIEAEDTASGNDEVKFKIIPNKGFALRSLRVITDSGEEVEFSEEELIKNEDGTVSFSDNKFTMPFDNVTIEASWEKIDVPKTPTSAEATKNPNTAAAMPATYCMLFGVLSAVIGLVVKKRLG